MNHASIIMVQSRVSSIPKCHFVAVTVAGSQALVFLFLSSLNFNAHL